VPVAADRDNGVDARPGEPPLVTRGRQEQNGVIDPGEGTMTIEAVLWTVLGLIALVGGVLLLSALWSLVKAKD